MIGLWRKYRGDKRGALVVEAALLLPFLVAAGLGVIDASYMMVQNHKVESQLSVAANFLSKSDAPQLRETAAKTLAVTGSISAGQMALIDGWNTGDISITYLTTDNADESYRGEDNIRTVQITTQIEYNGFGILSSILPNKPVLSASVQERIVGGGL